MQDGASQQKRPAHVRLVLELRSVSASATGFDGKHARVGNLLTIDNPLRGNVSGELEPTINF
jgi:hypothetical protein